MGFRDELRDPWGLVLGGVAGGLGWAIGLPVAAAAGVGAAVYGVKLLSGAVLNRAGTTAPGELPVRSGSPEARWLDRAERALSTFRRLGHSAQSGPVSERVQSMAEQAATTLDGVRRLAGQSSAIGSALERFDAEGLRHEARRLEVQARESGNEDVRTESERALESVRSQLAVFDRLREAARTLAARLESAVIGLEGLVARLVEVLALVQTQSPVEGAQRVDALADELEGLRQGLAETESLSRRVLSAYQGQGSLDAGGRPSSGGRVRWRSRERGGRDAEAS